MRDNPYEPRGDSHPNFERQSVNRRGWAVIGFFHVCIPVAALGVYRLYADAQCAAALPPNTPRSGNGALTSMIMICLLSAILGCVGALIGFVSAIVYDELLIDGGAHQESDKVRNN